MALLIGIENYDPCKEDLFGDKRLDNLTHPKQDVRAMKSFLENVGYRVITNLDQDAEDQYSKAYFEQRMEELEKICIENRDKKRYTHFFIYYSGHGVTSSDKD